MVKHLLNNGTEIYLDGYLKSALDSIIYNVDSDWDFVIIVTGDGGVRMGKSVFALQICSYIADRLETPFTIDNVFFDSIHMIEKAQHMPKNSVLQYDEAREGLASSKRGKKLQEDLLDFFNECGQLNHVFVLVLPDFFGLNWELATNRSECLVNVYRAEVGKEMDVYKEGKKIPITVFRRGFFEFHNRKKKQKLYWQGKKSNERNYNLIKPLFQGQFTHVYPIDQEAYREKKKEMLSRFDSRHKAQELKDMSYNKAEELALAVEKTIGKLPDVTARRFSELMGHDPKYIATLATARKKKEKIMMADALINNEVKEVNEEFDNKKDTNGVTEATEEVAW